MSRKQRLSADDWLNAGLKALAASGPQALKAEPLARALDTTKGSFYWHFEDVPRYRQDLLNFWRDASAKIPSRPSEKSEAVAQLHKIMKDGFGDDPATEAAMRSWATSDPDAAATIAELDSARLDHLGELLRQLGVTNRDLALSLYSAKVGMSVLDKGTRNDDALASLVDMVLALR
ncbi:MAG: TetR/AcrR family transcriptional regulator [Pseudomonadota bacterium]|jgi:AcrR family transcriptional regulator|uniref:Transcriptional regulator, TetR family n=1 Tax=Pseudooceanicola nitratireducens TaxID=517719 RepID=A0A1I1HTN3_9RHOB|nr:TetR/AcrR family transcriptional regulator [Pseudooceanicola nitratireducens]MEC9312844.1 TetR/AcrR family transcriptional regulator [Pseudomonadota bacterium]SEJ15443.1 transcriptional regulator, TetR family [Pseudooceanicola nitratireducens]SFC27165.1 transcriptional regulator, TetR family [Pseudooceanicola nitratireducens]